MYFFYLLDQKAFSSARSKVEFRFSQSIPDNWLAGYALNLTNILSPSSDGHRQIHLTRKEIISFTNSPTVDKSISIVEGCRRRQFDT